MADSSIQCPNCGAQIEITDALKKNLQDQLRAEYNQKWLDEKKKMEAQFQQKQVEKEKDIRKQLEEQLSLQMQDMKNQLEEQKQKIRESQEKELALLKRQRELEERERTLQLEWERKLTEERKKIQSDMMARISEEYKLKDAEKEKTIQDLRKQIDELKQKAELGSQQLQGEVFELEMENHLRNWFPGDEIEAVKKGARGADLIQRVRNPYHQYCGTILWETKRAKDWQKEWIGKIKEDMMQAKAAIGIIVTFALPKNINRIGYLDHVWVCDPLSAEGLAMALRSGLIDIAQAHQSRENMNEKMELLYRYLSGPEFRQKIQAIAEAFAGMKKDLEDEKTAMQRIWAKREAQIERVLNNTTRLYGTLQGIIGQTLSNIPQMELPGSAEEIK